MPSPASDRNLRRVVAKLAAADPEDVDLVLEALDDDQRREVRQLLDAYGAGPLALTSTASAPQAIAPSPEAAPDLSHLAGLSPWLAERMTGKGSAWDGRMTAAARAALTDATRAMPPVEPAPDEPLLSRTGRSGSKASRLWGLGRWG